MAVELAADENVAVVVVAVAADAAADATVAACRLEEVLFKIRSNPALSSAFRARIRSLMAVALRAEKPDEEFISIDSEDESKSRSPPTRARYKIAS